MKLPADQIMALLKALDESLLLEGRTLRGGLRTAAVGVSRG